MSIEEMKEGIRRGMPVPVLFWKPCPRFYILSFLSIMVVLFF
jgi:hypothetical protein